MKPQYRDAKSGMCETLQDKWAVCFNQIAQGTVGRDRWWGTCRLKKFETQQPDTMYGSYVDIKKVKKKMLYDNREMWIQAGYLPRLKSYC